MFIIILFLASSTWAAEEKYDQIKLIYATAELQGKRPAMQDAHIIYIDDQVSLFAVFDGHGLGVPGNNIAKFAAKNLLELCRLEDTGKFDEELFFKSSQALDQKLKEEHEDWYRTSGTTMCGFIIIKNQLHIANLGDSRALIVFKNHKFLATIAHRPCEENLSEKQRILSAGAYITHDGYINDHINFTRSIGDGILPDPERQIAGLLDKNNNKLILPVSDNITHDLTGQEDFIILACDGLWDFMTYQQVGQYVTKRRQELGEINQDTTNLIAQELAEKVINDHKSTDNVTVLVIFFTQPQHAANSQDGNHQ